METLSRWMFVLDRRFSPEVFAPRPAERWGPLCLEVKEGELRGLSPGGDLAFVVGFRRGMHGWTASWVDVKVQVWRGWSEEKILEWIKKKLLAWQSSGTGPEGKGLSLGSFDLAGTWYRVKEPLVLQTGEILAVLLESENLHDPLAVAVKTMGGHLIGYLPRPLNQMPANMLKAGERFYARISAWDGKKITVDLFWVGNINIQ